MIRRVKSAGGMTLVELLISVFLVGVLSVAAFQFYSSLNQQVISQQEFCDMQQVSRACLEEISTTLRAAGSGLSGHTPFEVAGNTLFVYYRGSQPVDTVAYYLEEFSETEYAEMIVGRTADMVVYKLMKQENSDPPLPFADHLTGLQFDVINSGLVSITLQVQAPRPDETFNQNEGFRTFDNAELVVIRGSKTI